MIRHLSVALFDIWAGAGKWQLWAFLARDDLFTLHRKTLLGFLWEPISYIILVAALGPLYAGLMRVPLEEYLLYFSAGWLAWRLISGLIASSTSTYLSAAKIITQVKLPYSFYSYKQVCNIWYILLLNLPVFLLLVLFSGSFTKIAPLSALLALLIYMVTGFFLSIVIGYCSLVFRDLRAIIDNVMRIAFFVTPVIWGYDIRGEGAEKINWSVKSAYIDYNPFYHFLVLLREPLLGHPVPLHSYWFSLSLMSSLIMTGLYVLSVKRRKFAYLV